MKLKKGDTVLVIAGKDKNKTGKVEKALPKKEQIIVSGVNIAKKHSKATKKEPHGGIIQLNMPLSAGKVMLICPACNKAVRVGYKKISKGKKVRICQKCKESVEPR